MSDQYYFNFNFHDLNTGSRKFDSRREPKRSAVPQVFPDKQYNKILFIAGHSTVCEDVNAGCSALPVFRPPVDVLFTASYGDLVGLYGLFYDVLRRFCTGLRVQPHPQFSLPTIATMLKKLNRVQEPPSGLTGFFHNLNLSFHEQDSETSNMFLFQPGKGFDTVEASGVYLISPDNITSLLNTTPNGEIERGCNLFSNPALLSNIGIAKTEREVRVDGQTNGKNVYGYANPSFVIDRASNPRTQRIKLSYLLRQLEIKQPNVLQGALVIVASCRGFEGEDEKNAAAHDSPRAGDFTDVSEDEELWGGNRKRSHGRQTKTAKKRAKGAKGAKGAKKRAKKISHNTQKTHSSHVKNQQ